ncbi:MAG: hydroxyacylglutathione hydrolase [Holosporales bacterium]
MKQFDVITVPTLKDNYSYLLVNRTTQEAIVIDPSEAAPILEVLTTHQLRLMAILNTHHHWDHVGGNQALKNQTQAPIIAHGIDAEKIDGVDIRVHDGENLHLAGMEIQPIHIPGHTLGHTAYHVPTQGWVFTGDTLFSLGCGRLFEGTAAMMHQSLQRLAALPQETLIFPGHEYTAANGQFARVVDPNNTRLIERLEHLPQTRCIAPVTLALERATNPFLRCHRDEMAQPLGLKGRPAVEVFTRLRQMKDEFRSE